MSWAEIKKLNSDLTTPLDKAIKDIYNKTFIANTYAINQEHDATGGDETTYVTVLEIEGRGRLLGVVPINVSDVNTNGESVYVHVSIDGVTYCHRLSLACERSGSTNKLRATLVSEYLLNAMNKAKNVSGFLIINGKVHYFHNTSIVIPTPNNVNYREDDTTCSDYFSDGIYFENNLTIKAGKAYASNNIQLLIIYELFN